MNSFHILISLFLLTAFCSSHVAHGNAEVRALMELKSSLDPEGKILSSWSSDGDPCSGSFFQGVECNEHHKVVNISLQGKGLSGWLSPAVAELQCLSGLYLHYNNLSGEIPIQISNLTDLVDLYLDVNSLSGTIPPQLGNMASLQVLQLADNHLEGNIPPQLGSLNRLTALALQYNKLSGQIPPSLGKLEKLSRLNLSFNNLSGSFPTTLAHITPLEVLDIQNNSLSGIVPSALKRLGEGFQAANNPGLCGVGFSTLTACNRDQDLNVNYIDTSNQDLSKSSNPEKALTESATVQLHCNQAHCSRSRSFSQTVVTASSITIALTFLGAGLFAFFRYRHQKQRISNTSDSSDGKLSPDQPKEFYRKSPSTIVNREYFNGWDPLSDYQNADGSFNEHLNKYRFHVDEVESATQYFSEANLLGKSKFSAVYKGVLRDGSLVAIRSINVTCCKAEEVEFANGLILLTSLKHKNLVRLRGFCCSRSRGECFLIYDFATKGNLSQHLDMEDESGHVLDWSKRVSIIKGIANGIGYLHSNEASKPIIVHQNISVENVALDNQFDPLIMDAGLPKLLADDVVFSALKVSAAMGYLAPEYITTGRCNEKSDIYAFGVIILQVLSGKKTIGSSTWMAVESFKFDDFVDINLRGRYSKSEAAVLSKLASICTHELPDQRPTMVEVIKELSMLPAHL